MKGISVSFGGFSLDVLKRFVQKILVFVQIRNGFLVSLETKKPVLCSGSGGMEQRIKPVYEEL